MTPTGYATIPRAVIARIYEIGPVAFAVFGVLTGHADEAGESFPCIETIGRMIGVTDRTVRRALSALESAGLVVRKHRRRDTTVYTTQARTLVSAQELSPDKNDRKPGQKRPLSPDTGVREIVHQERTPRTKEKRSPSNGQYDPLAADLPFESADFRTAWSDFAEMRREKKKPLTDRAAKIVLRKLAEWGEPAAIESLEASTVSEWQGVFPPKANGKAAGNGQPQVCKVLTVEEYKNWNPYNGGGI